MSTRLRATYRHPGAPTYRAPGGAWDVPALDEALAVGGVGSELLVDGATRLVGAALDAAVAALAGGLRARGVGRRDVVAWQLPNWHEAVLLYRACWRLGAVAAPIHHLAGPVEVEALLAAMEPKVVAGAAGLPAGAAPGAFVVRGDGAFEELLVTGTSVLRSPASAADIAVVLFTSGSTGMPKSVLHTHRGLACKARLMTGLHGLRPDDCILMPAPLAHVSGLQNAVTIPGVVPMKAVLMDRWDPEVALDLIERERVTFMIGPPTFFVSLMAAPGFTSTRVSSLRLVSSGGAGVTPAFVTEASARLGCRVKRTYGSTEAPTVTTSGPDDPEDRARETDGRALGGVELRVVDPETRRAMRPGERGELWLRGPELFAGYADPEQTAAAMARGWFRTGDLAVVDADGWLTIVGRIKDVIIRGGENISASEVESVLEAHESVRQAVAVGYPDERMGERVAAFVVAPATFDLDECRRWFAARGVARFKTPELVVNLDEMPTLAAGKPDRAALRARLA